MINYFKKFFILNVSFFIILIIVSCTDRQKPIEFSAKGYLYTTSIQRTNFIRSNLISSKKALGLSYFLTSSPTNRFNLGEVEYFIITNKYSMTITNQLLVDNNREVNAKLSTSLFEPEFGVPVVKLLKVSEVKSP